MRSPESSSGIFSCGVAPGQGWRGRLVSSEVGRFAVKRFLACWCLLLLPIVEFARSAGAVGLGFCRISGPIAFSPRTAIEGQWSIEKAVIDCQGLLAGGRRRFLGPGPFKGSGSYSALPAAGGACLHQAGSGTVEYSFPTSGGYLVISEPGAYTLAGARPLTPPTLRRTFGLAPPDDGDSRTKPAANATVGPTRR